MVLSKILNSIPKSFIIRAIHDQRAIQNKKPQGLTWASLKHHYSLQPLFFIMGCVIVGAAGFAIRSFNRNVSVFSDVSPYWEYRNKQHKFMHYIPRDFSKPHIAPNYREMTDEEGENYEMPIKNFVIKRE